jgi:glutamine---fructose-6-phosphate transaminase (isomerizing)
LTISRTEEDAKKAASELRGVSKIFFAGAGPNFVTAREAALKIKEACYLAGEGMEMEEILHGPAMSFDNQTLVVVLAPSGPSIERARDLLAASKKIGATTMVVSDLADFNNADYEFRINKTHEYLSPFLSIIPLYFFSYFLAVEKRINPDYIHYLDQKYWDARNIIFPPDTH